MVLSIVFCIVVLAMVIYTSFESMMLISHMLARRGRVAAPAATGTAKAKPTPHVTVQLPIYNERAVALTLIDAVARFVYPRDRLSIQVLDDSTDGSSAMIAEAVDRLQREGVDISHIRRETRTGWKAGALAYGLTLSDSAFVAIFDADFVPPPDYLNQALIEGDAFANPKVAYVQGRWTFANDGQNLLTSVQAIMIDRHFVIQKPYQIEANGTVMFNGSGGIWRRAAIDAVGGWSADTLCEDLDLSLRCALGGWVGAYEQSLESPSEIPSSILAFKLQQRRWAEGSVQCLRKLGSNILHSKSLQNRWLDLHGILAFIIYPLTLIFTMMWPWMVLSDTPRPLLWVGQACFTVSNVVALAVFVLATVDTKRKLDLRWLRVLVFALVIGLAMAVNNTAALLLGCFKRFSVFERTPKQGPIRAAAPSYAAQLHWSIRIEILFALYGFWLAAVLVGENQSLQALPCLWLSMSLVLLIVYQLVERFPSERWRLQAVGQ